jgi:uncharacterized damage-inducible protein DinB
MTTHCYPYRHDNWACLKPALEKLTPEQLLWKPQGCDSIGKILAHMAGCENFWINELAGLGPILLRDPLPESDAECLLLAYEKVRAQTEGILHSLKETDLKRVVDVPEFSDGWEPPSTPTLHWVFHHVFDHESYHCGQIALLMRMQGLEPPIF